VKSPTPALNSAGGIYQRVDSVAQMDQGTQQNAALVEERAAALKPFRLD
jgi:methyl-accepting chemotaxis protein